MKKPAYEDTRQCRGATWNGNAVKRKTQRQRCFSLDGPGNTLGLSILQDFRLQCITIYYEKNEGAR